MWLRVEGGGTESCVEVVMRNGKDSCLTSRPSGAGAGGDTPLLLRGLRRRRRGNTREVQIFPGSLKWHRLLEGSWDWQKTKWNALWPFTLILKSLLDENNWKNEHSHILGVGYDHEKLETVGTRYLYPQKKTTKLTKCVESYSMWMGKASL